MPLPAFIFPILAVAADAPVVVTGHAWAPFISPMGEPFRAHTAADDTLADWFARADRNRDGALTVDELQADAERFFTTLDDDHDGEIDPDELIHYESEIAPDIQVNSKTRRAPGDTSPPRKRDAGDDGRGGRSERDGGLQGAARYALLNIPEPVAAADTDFNRSITLDEFRRAAIARFQMLDPTRSGRIALPQLEVTRSAMIAAGRAKRGKDDPDQRFANPLPAEN
jgi:Ca2+-binding EF-hand superfamily protein